MSKDRFKLIAVAYIILRREDGAILFSQRAGTGYQDGNYMPPGGHFEGDEVATEVAVREAREELGITLRQEDLKLVHILHRLNRNEAGQERMDLFFEATRWEGEPYNAEPERCGGLVWCNPATLPEQTIPYIRDVMQHIAAGRVYSETVTDPAV